MRTHPHYPHKGPTTVELLPVLPVCMYSGKHAMLLLYQGWVQSSRSTAGKRYMSIQLAVQHRTQCASLTPPRHALCALRAFVEKHRVPCTCMYSHHNTCTAIITVPSIKDTNTQYGVNTWVVYTMLNDSGLQAWFGQRYGDTQEPCMFNPRIRSTYIVEPNG